MQIVVSRSMYEAALRFWRKDVLDRVVVVSDYIPSKDIELIKNSPELKSLIASMTEQEHSGTPEGTWTDELMRNAAKRL